jgi:hypothetical protein
VSPAGSNGGALKLRAEDAEDLRVIAACLQDSLISLSDVKFDANDHRFVLVANRFRWENCSESADMPVHSGDGDPVPDPVFAACANYERVNCGICFENVAQVRRRGFDPRDRGRILELLTMEVESGAAGGGSAVILVFAGGAAIRLEGENITCRVGDIGDPWPTQWRPYHPADQTA